MRTLKHHPNFCYYFVIVQVLILISSCSDPSANKNKTSIADSIAATKNKSGIKSIVFKKDTFYYYPENEISSIISTRRLSSDLDLQAVTMRLDVDQVKLINFYTKELSGTDEEYAYKREYDYYIDEESPTDQATMTYVRKSDLIEGNLSSITVSPLSQIYSGDIDAIIFSINEISNAYRAITSIENPNKTIISKTKKLRNRISSIQSKYFPAMRRAWVRDLKREFITADLNIRVVLNGSVITLIGTAFASDVVVNEAYNNLLPKLHDLRFKSINFVYSEYEDYIHYSVETMKDTEI